MTDIVKPTIDQLRDWTYSKNNHLDKFKPFDDDGLPIIYEIDELINEQSRWGVYVEHIYYRPSDKTYWSVTIEETNESTYVGGWDDLDESDIEQVEPVEVMRIEYKIVQPKVSNSSGS